MITNEERAALLAELDAKIQRGLDDIAAGRVYDADEVFVELEAELTALIEAEDSKPRNNVRRSQ